MGRHGDGRVGASGMGFGVSIGCLAKVFSRVGTRESTRDALN